MGARMQRLLMIALAAFGLGVTSASADEIWMTVELGEVVYQEEIGDVTILTASAPNGLPLHFYFPGLAGNYDDRSSHDGFWIMQGSGPCSGKLTGVDGVASTNWGAARILFDDPSFPTPWTMLGGFCLGPLETYVRGELIY